MTTRIKEKRNPKVNEAGEFVEIILDFTDPKEVIRESISNAIDWGATEINIEITEDKNRTDEELVIKIKDNGIGLNKERLHAFFDLGKTIEPLENEKEITKINKIGYKGHGTKIYYNSRQIEVFSDSAECSVYASIEEPLQRFINGEIPEYEYDIEEKYNRKTFTEITIRGYNNNQNKRDFGHKVLKDYILWYSRFGSVEKEFEIFDNKDKLIKLKGLACKSPETIKFGHGFAKENSDIQKLRKKSPADWTNIYAKKWIFPESPIINNPGKYIDLVFYIEGDDAKRSYNPMIRNKRKTSEYGMYKVEDRYGLWACKDYIPIKKYNEWLGLGKRLETKYHAFVNCQDFRLTANRGEIGNTPPILLETIKQTVKQIFEEEIQGSSEYQEYEEAAELEQQYQTYQQENKDFERRKKRFMKKRVCKYKDIELIEPSVEMGVISLFNIIYALEQNIFPFRIIDYDSKKGYDALVAQKTPYDLNKDTMSFIEFKYMLTKTFNHSFDHLRAIVCWNCNLSDNEEVRDIRNKRRKLRIIPPENDHKYHRYMLTTLTEQHNIEVYVLKYYLRERLNIKFKLRIKNNNK